jgi:hypothetical protein
MLKNQLVPWLESTQFGDQLRESIIVPCTLVATLTLPQCIAYGVLEEAPCPRQHQGHCIWSRLELSLCILWKVDESDCVRNVQRRVTCRDNSQEFLWTLAGRQRIIVDTLAWCHAECLNVRIAHPTVPTRLLDTTRIVEGEMLRTMTSRAPLSGEEQLLKPAAVVSLNVSELLQRPSAATTA